MKTFREFLRGFKVKYRIALDRERGLASRVLSSPEEGEIVLYETYLRRMRQTGDTNLNLDMMNLAAYPPSRKLQGQLAKYPQEVIPAMDQVLKDLMLEIASEDQDAGMQGMQGPQGEAEISDIMAKVYKIRPFGIQAINLRDLNPTGTYYSQDSVHFIARISSTSLTSENTMKSRYGQVGVHQRISYSRNPSHPRHESSLLSLSNLQPHHPRRNRPW